MFILGTDNSTRAELNVAEPGIRVMLPVEIDWHAGLEAADEADWENQYQILITLGATTTRYSVSRRTTMHHHDDLEPYQLESDHENCSTHAWLRAAEIDAEIEVAEENGMEGYAQMLQEERDQLVF